MWVMMIDNGYVSIVADLSNPEINFDHKYPYGDGKPGPLPLNIAG